MTAWSRKHWLVGRKAFETIWLKCSNCSPDSALGKGASYLLLVTAVAAEATKGKKRMKDAETLYKDTRRAEVGEDMQKACRQTPMKPARERGGKT